MATSRMEIVAETDFAAVIEFDFGLAHRLIVAAVAFELLQQRYYLI